MRQTKGFKRAISVFLTVSILAGICGCAKTNTKDAEKAQIEPMEIEEAVNYSMDAIGGEDVMPIMGFYGPVPSEFSYNGNALPDYFTEEFYQLVADTGINMIGTTLANYGTVPSYVKKSLELGEKVGLGILVQDKRILSNDLTLEEVDEMTHEYTDYPSFAGVFMVDEPGAVYFRDHENGTNVDEFDTISKNLKELGFYVYENLLGMHATDTYTEEDVEAYTRYMRDWVKHVNPQALYYDRYIFEDNEGLKMGKKYFKNMEICRSVAEESGIPFWTYIEAGQQFTDKGAKFDTEAYFPSRGEFMWNVGTALAFGTKGILYFPLIQPIFYAYAESTPFDFQRNGLIGAWGNKTRWYYYAQDMNAQIAATDEILMHAVNKGVIASGEQANEHLSDCQYLMKGKAWREIADVTGDAMIGCFNYKGKTALYVVNYDIEYAQKITLGFVDTYNMTIIQNAETTHTSCSSLELTFAAGESALIVIE